jgi:hypothetical protein
VIDVKLRIVDAVCGPEPETEADRQRAAAVSLLARSIADEPQKAHVETDKSRGRLVS